MESSLRVNKDIHEAEHAMVQTHGGTRHISLYSTLCGVGMLRNRDAEEYAYHLEQSQSYMDNQIVWESRQEDIKRSRPYALERKYVLSLHKIHIVPFPEEDLEEKINCWVRKEFKTFNKEARLSFQQWKDSRHNRIYKVNYKRVKDNSKEFFSDHKIFEVVRINTEQQHGLDFMEQLIVMRENNKPYCFSEADFKYLNKNDIEDMYFLFLNKKVSYRENKLLSSIMTFIKSSVI
ncbi:hypothetical protein Tco_0403608 [Tanacetum coccineum]